MREPTRIFLVLNEIAVEWVDKCPDWRFMQLINNFISWLGHDGFYLEDDDMIERFKEFMRTI